MNYSDIKYIKKIKKYGFVKIENYITSKKASDYKNLVLKKYDNLTSKRYRGTPKRDERDKILYNLQNKSFEFIKLITNKRILNIAKYFLNDPYYRFIESTKPNFNLLYLNARSSGNKLDLHIDTHLPFKGDRTNMMQFVILLENSTIENGCTLVVPGSHKSGKFSDRKSKKKLTITGNPGDLIIWDSRLWHGTCENLTNKTRWAVVITYGAWWLKPMMDITKSLPNHIYKKCTKVQKQILGFCAIPPKTEFERINTKTGYKNLKRNVSDYL